MAASTKSRSKSAPKKNTAQNTKNASGKKTTANKSSPGENRGTSSNTTRTTSRDTSRTTTRNTTNRAGIGKNTRSAAAKSKQRSQEMIKERNRVRSVILFVVAIFIGCLVLIDGNNLWLWAHNAVLGIFGGWAILGPILMIYVAVVTSMESPKSSLNVKIWLTVFIIILFCSAGFIFTGKLPTEELGFTEYIKFLFYNNAGAGGGVIGGAIGNLLIKAAGGLGAKIIIVLLIFASIMILTGATLIQLFRTLRKPVDVVSDSVKSARQRYDEKQQEKAANIDIRLPGELPDGPVLSEGNPLFEPIKDKKPKTENKQLKKLHEVFGIGSAGDSSGANSESSSNNNVAENPAKEEIFSPKLEKTFAEAQKAKEQSIAYEKTKEIISTSKPVQTLDVINEGKDDIQAAIDAEKAAKEFIKRRDENDRKELNTAIASNYNNAEGKADTYVFPPVTMLEAGKNANLSAETEELQTNGRILVETLKSFGVQTKIVDICRGPSVTRYELQPAAGVKISKITGLSDDLAMNLASTGVRIEAPIPGKAAVGIEVPNKIRTSVKMRDLIESNSFISAKGKLTVALGRDIAGQVVTADLAKMPHLLIAGTTGSGKSVCVNSFIISILYKASPDDVRFLMIDPKQVEFGIYNGIPHLLVPVVTDPRKAAGALGWAVSEMLKRYQLFAENNVRDIEGYNNLAASMGYHDENGQPMNKMPQIVIFIDELSDLMMAAPNEVEDAICRLAQMARAAGMHLVVATQRPSVDVVTGLIKANIPSRIALTVSSQVDSRTILDSMGAEKLLGNGDMLFAPIGSAKPLRVQGCYVSDSEVESIVEFVKNSRQIDYDEEVISEIEKNAVAEPTKGGSSGDADESRDAMMDEAIKCVVEAGQASTSMLQRRLRVGYARAGRLIDDMEQMGIVGPHEGAKPRQVLMSHAQWLEMNMQKADNEQG